MTLTRVIGDARELCFRRRGKVGLVITDPPYPTLKRHRAVGTTTRLQSHTFDLLTHEEILGVIAFLGDRLIPGAYVIFATDIWSWLHLARHDGIDAMEIRRSARAPRGELTGLWWRHPWTWIKTTKDGSKPYGGTGYHGRGCTEMIAILQKPCKRSIPALKKRLAKKLNVVFSPRIKHGDAYPTQKPQDLGRKLLKTFALRGLPVIDPFSGSGRWLIDPAKELDLDLELWDVNPETEKIISSGDWE